MTISELQVSAPAKKLDRTIVRHNTEESNTSTILFPQVDVILGDVNLVGDELSISIPPEYIIAFEYEESISIAGGQSPGANSFSLSLFDRTGGLLDIFLALNLMTVQANYKKTLDDINKQGEIKQKPSITNRLIKFRFGYPYAKSDWRLGHILSIKPGNISKEGIYVTISGLDIGSASALSTEKETYAGSLYDIISGICRLKGWKLKVEDGLESSLKGIIIESMVCNGSHLSFLRDLISKANFGERLCVKFNAKVTTGVPELQIVSAHYDERASLLDRFIVNVGADFGDGEYKENSKVLSFSVDIKGELAATGYGAEQLNVIVDNKDSLESVVKQITSKIKYKGRDGCSAMGKYDPAGNGGTQGKIGWVSEYDNISDNLIINYYNSLKLQCIDADMEVLGNINYEPFKYINVDVLLPDGKLYYTSGLYFVTGVTHSISGGSFITKLKLFKDGSSMFGGEVVKAESVIKQTIENRYSEISPFKKNKDVEYGGSVFIGGGQIHDTSVRKSSIVSPRDISKLGQLPDINPEPVQ